MEEPGNRVQIDILLAWKRSSSCSSSPLDPHGVALKLVPQSSMAGLELGSLCSALEGGRNITRQAR